MAKYSKHQESIIKNYYQNREAIAFQRVQESLTELYLAEGKKRLQCWKRVVGHLEKLGVPTAQIDHFVAKDQPALVAKLLEDIMNKK